MNDFPRADIYRIIMPDLLHQVIKGTFKDHLVLWVCMYLETKSGHAKAQAILDEMDRRFVIAALNVLNSNRAVESLQFRLFRHCGGLRKGEDSNSGPAMTRRP